MSIARREFLTGAAGVALTANLGGCVLRPPQPFCPNDPTLSDPTTPLTIDAHAHLFNGSDIPVNEFLTKIDNVPGIGVILDELSWSVVPSGADEIVELEKLAPYVAACDQEALKATKADLARKQYGLARDQLQSAAKTVSRRAVARDMATSDALSIIADLPQDLEEYKKAKSVNRLPGARLRKSFRLDIGGAIDFVLLMFQYRYVIVSNFLQEYSTGRRRRIDLTVGHIVDYDWPIAHGAQTPTPLPCQIEVMSKICALTGGRIHCYTPFDPIKQVAFDQGFFGAYSPFALAQDAVLNKGCLGIKLYPVMGFRPFGNSKLPNGYWNQPWFRADLLRATPDFGRRLDEALGMLYEWCIQNDVPVMAHTSPSNGPHEGKSTKFYELTDPEWWDLALKNFPRLRINFGHFGGYDEAAEDLERIRAFMSLMSSAGPGQLAVADTAYYPEVIDSPAALLARLRGFYRETASKGDAALAQRLMFATDWHMLVARGSETSGYLNGFMKLYDTLDKDASLGAQGRLSDRFFGLNAAKHLGLRNGDANRLRIDEFYAREGVANAQHLAKIDGLAAKVAPD